MLVLSRHENEAIVIGGDIRIVVVSIRGDKVRLGIEAPQDVSVHRLEVQNAINRQDSRAATGGPAADVRNANKPVQPPPGSNLPVPRNHS